MKNILIIKPSSLGDIIHTFPAIVMIASEYPEINIDWLVGNNFSEILNFLPPVRRVIPFQRQKLGKPLTFVPAVLELWKMLRQQKYDLVIDLQGLLRSALMARMCRAKEVVGFSKPRENIAHLFYHRTYDPPPEYSHAVERNIFLISQALNMESDLCDFDLPEHFESASLINEMLSERGISDTDITIGIIPGARWETKRWPPVFFAEIIKRITEYNDKIKFILIGSGNDTYLAEKILAETSEKNVVNCVGETNIGELVELIRKCHYILSNDSGPMHIGAALGIPVFALFGPTDPDRCGPYGSGNVVFQPDLECLKCYKRECDKTDKCIKNIKAAVIADNIIARIEKDSENANN